MPRYYFECLIDGVIHRDDFGIDLQGEEIEDEAKEIVTILLNESTKKSSVVIVTVRAEDGHPAHIAHGVIGNYKIGRDPSTIQGNESEKI